jgi:multidrug efflux pump
MYAIIDAAINRSRTTLLILAMIVIAGVAADRAILVESEPHIEIPFFIVTIPHEGISPEDSERLLVMPVETEMRSIEGIKEMTSYSSEGAGTVVVEFNADYPLAKASIDVRDAVDRAKSKIPSTAKEPIVQEASNNDFPIIQVNLMGDDVPERVLYNVAVQLRDDIEAIPEVLEAELNGERKAVINPSALESYHISNEQLLMNIVNKSLFWVPLSQAIVWGLTFATVLTLVCTPAMLALPHVFKRMIARKPRDVAPTVPRESVSIDRA